MTIRTTAVIIMATSLALGSVIVMARAIRTVWQAIPDKLSSVAGLALTSIATIGLIAAIVAQWPHFPPPSAPDEIQEHISRLKKTQGSLAALSDFLDEQQTRLLQAERDVQALAKEASDLAQEKESLESVLEIKRDDLRRILARARRRDWLDLVVAFATGVAASITAALFYHHIWPGRGRRRAFAAADGDRSIP